MRTMNAMLWTAYGSPDVLQLRTVAKPTPRDNEVLIKIHAATVTMGDCEMRTLRFPLMYRLPLWLYIGLRKPHRIPVLGQEVAGEIEAVGQAVTRFKPGDQIFAACLFRFGAYAEYICLPESYPIAPKPATMRYAEAATLPTGGVNGLHLLRRAHVQAGDQLLINGAGGSIGTYALQLAKAKGVTVTAVDRGSKSAMLHALGADHVIDYTQTDFTKTGVHYDAIIDIVGKRPFGDSLRALKPKGRYVLGNPNLPAMLKGKWAALTSDKQVTFDLANYKLDDLHFLKAQAEAGTIKAVIDRTFSLAETAAAHRYVDTGQKAGNVIITVLD